MRLVEKMVMGQRRQLTLLSCFASRWMLEIDEDEKADNKKSESSEEPWPRTCAFNSGSCTADISDIEQWEAQTRDKTRFPASRGLAPHKEHHSDDRDRQDEKSERGSAQKSSRVTPADYAPASEPSPTPGIHCADPLIPRPRESRSLAPH